MAASIIPATWQIPAAIRNRLGNSAGRQRTMAAEDHLLLVLHAPPKPDDSERSGRFFWRSPQGDWLSKDLGSGIRAWRRTSTNTTMRSANSIARKRKPPPSMSIFACWNT